jgi:RNA polymerase sigma factor (TIGR02999 family)
MTDLTRNLSTIEQGEPRAAEQLLPLVYDELRRLATAKMAHEKPGQTLQPTALVHEAYLRLVDGDHTRHWEGRRHFFAAAAEAMRRILINRARDKHRLKRGGVRKKVDLDRIEASLETPPEDLLAFDEALEKLARQDRTCAELVRLRFFAGLSVGEAAEALGISPRTADRYWVYARAWLYEELR